MDGLKRLKTSLSVLQSHCKSIQDVLNNAQILELKALKLKFEGYVAKIRYVDTELLSLITDEEELEKETSDSLLARDNNLETLAGIEGRVSELRINKEGSSSLSSSLSSPKARRASNEKVGFPMYEQPKFNGDKSYGKLFGINTNPR